MYARAVDEASSHLRELRQEEWQDLGLAALSIGLALAATQVRPDFAMPLFLGGVVVGAHGLRALWRRWDLVERLAGERDAYVIPEVLACAAREATLDRRHTCAVLIRAELQQTGLAYEDRVMLAAEELEALACELEDLLSDVSRKPAAQSGAAPGAASLAIVRSDPASTQGRPPDPSRPRCAYLRIAIRAVPDARRDAARDPGRWKEV